MSGSRVLFHKDLQIIVKENIFLYKDLHISETVLICHEDDKINSP